MSGGRAGDLGRACARDHGVTANGEYSFALGAMKLFVNRIIGRIERIQITFVKTA